MYNKERNKERNSMQKFFVSDINTLNSSSYDVSLEYSSLSCDHNAFDGLCRVHLHNIAVLLIFTRTYMYLHWIFMNIYKRRNAHQHTRYRSLTHFILCNIVVLESPHMHTN